MNQPTIGIIANPLSGRDVRRIAARGAVATNEDKRNRIARAVVGAVSTGVTRVVAMAEPFSIAAGALTDLRLGIDTEIIDVGHELNASSTTRAALAMRDLGVHVVVVLGGDGTNRIISMAWPDVVLAPMSTGTNNVFPTPIEPTIVGTAAGLVAIDLATGGSNRNAWAPRAKVVRVSQSTPNGTNHELALIDAVHIVDDFLGNRMPYEPESLRTLVVSRAEPASIGVSAIAGRTCPVSASDDAGVVVDCGPGGQPVSVPLGPGLFRTVPVRSARRIGLGEAVTISGPGLVAYDGDRMTSLNDHPATVVVERTGPRVVDVPAVMMDAAHSGKFGGDVPRLDGDMRR